MRRGKQSFRCGFMDWDKKVKMLDLAQNSENLTEFHQFVQLHIDSFDSQAWSMLVNVLELTKQYAESNKDFLKVILEKMNKANECEEGIGLSIRDLVRFGALEELIDGLK